MRTKIRNLVSGNVQDRTFRAGENIVAADVVKTEMQYIYSNGGKLFFMNMETFEEQSVDEILAPDKDMLIEGRMFLFTCTCSSLQFSLHFVHCNDRCH